LKTTDSNNWPHFSKSFSQQSFWQNLFQQSSYTKEQIESLEKIVYDHKVHFPACDLFQKDELLYLEVELPGLTKEDVHVKLQDGKIILEGNYNTFKPGHHYFLKERVSKTFSKEITLPLPVKSKKITYTFKHGLLQITLPIETDHENSIPINVQSEAHNH